MKIRNSLVVLILTVIVLTLVFLFGSDSLWHIFHFGPGTFVNESGGYSINYPNGWIAFEMPNGQHGEKEVSGMLTNRNQDSPNLTIRQFELDSPTFEEAIQWEENRIIDRYNEYGTYQFDLTEYKTINDNLIATRTYTLTFQEKGNSLKNIDAFIISDRTIFILTFSSRSTEFEKNIPVFHKMSESFIIN